MRQRQGARIVLTSYGRASGFCVDPIEKKPLNHFYPGSSILSFGGAGCNLACKFCQNWDISKARAMDALGASATPEGIAEQAQALGCRSVAFTYNEPITFAEYAIDTAAECRARGVATVAVTAGYITPRARRDFFAAMDAANIDLKAFTEDFYARLCAGALEPVLDTLRYVCRETDVWTELTTLLIPGQNDSDDEIGRLASWVARELGPGVPLHFTAFHPDYRLTDTPRTPPERCRRAREIARREGLHHVYTGNIADSAGQSTYCAGCGRVVIERSGYSIGDVTLQNGCCPHCGAAVPGRFDESAVEHWGPLRLKVEIE